MIVRVERFAPPVEGVTARASLVSEHPTAQQAITALRQLAPPTTAGTFCTVVAAAHWHGGHFEHEPEPAG